MTGLRNHRLDSRHATATGSARNAPDLSRGDAPTPFHVLVAAKDRVVRQHRPTPPFWNLGIT
ncbi:hypothetical protein FW320_13830 [Azospirillum sp. Vi22]|nr:hypothetical protein [Azospirillum baldaniorum]